MGASTTAPKSVVQVGRDKRPHASAPDHFSKDALIALRFAASEATRAGHSETWTSDLLIGMLRADRGHGPRMLKALGIRLDDLRDRVPGAPPGANEPVCTPRHVSRVQVAVRRAREEAGRAAARGIGTMDLLIGLLEEGEGVAATLLHTSGVDLEAVRAAIGEIERSGTGEE